MQGIMKKFGAFVATGLLLQSMSGVASATIIEVTSNKPILSNDLVAITSDFTDIPNGTFLFPGDPFTRGDVTYTTANNLIIGSGAGGYNFTGQSLIVNNLWTPLTGTISAATNKYDKFGFDIGQYGGTPITVELTTNLGSYSYNYLTIADMQTGDLQYLGYEASVSSGEYFTGFNIIADNGSGFAPGITNVTVATSAPTPEPSTYALMGIGGLFAVFLLKKSGAGSAIPA